MRKAGVKVFQKDNAMMVEDIKPDVVVAATGSASVFDAGADGRTFRLLMSWQVRWTSETE
jgi:hypothetical protein